MTQMKTNAREKGLEHEIDKRVENIWRLATWNIRALNGKEQELSNEFDSLNFDIMTVTETKKKGRGEILLEDGHLFVYSGVAHDRRAAEGVGCIVNKEIAENIRKWEAHTERLLSIEIDIGEQEIITVIAAYGPNEDEAAEIKDRFWEDLNEVTERSRGKVYVAGDLNGRVGNDSRRNNVIGKHGEEKVNNNGRRIIDFCTLNNMIVTNTYYEHKDIHKYTRQGKGKNDRSIIDYILTERNNRKDVLDVRVRRGPEIYTDHYLLGAKIKKNTTTQENKRDSNEDMMYETIKVYKLRNKDTAFRYTGEINTKIEREAILDKEENLENLWRVFKKIIIETAKERCGILKVGNRRKQTAWWNQDIKLEVKIKKQKWQVYLGAKTKETYDIYKRQRIKVKNMIKEAKENSWKAFGERMETNSKENQKLFYKTLKGMRGEKKLQHIAIKDKEGKIVKEEQRVMCRWKQHFEELLSVRRTDTVYTVREEEKSNTEMEEMREVRNNDLITMDEMKDALRWLKNGKAPGHDRVTAEMLKNLNNEGLQLLLEIFNRAWIEKKIPEDWKIGVLLPIHKKGDTKVCSNYRGITLLSTALKTYERILEKRLTEIVESTLGETQSGFRKGRSIQDHIFTVKQIIDKTLLSNTQAYFAFVDLEKAFDKVNRRKLWEILKKRRVSEQLIETIKSVYAENLNYVIYKNLKSEPFGTSEGLRQGGVLSPVLFCIYMDEIIKECTLKTKKLTVGYRRLTPVEVTECAFADDLVIMAGSETNLQKNLEIWEDTFIKFEMNINVDKTKVMVISREQEDIKVELKGGK